MAVEIIYAVVRKGVQVMTCTTAEEARKHDQMLDQADALQAILASVPETAALLDEAALEALAVALAKRRDEVLVALGAKRETKAEPKTRKPRSQGVASEGEPGAEGGQAA